MTSDALLLRRDFHDDPIWEPVNQSDKALVGVRPFKDVDALVIKMEWGGLRRWMHT